MRNTMTPDLQAELAAIERSLAPSPRPRLPLVRLGDGRLAHAGQLARLTSDRAIYRSVLNRLESHGIPDELWSGRKQAR
jgi:hypothetical protein